MEQIVYLDVSMDMPVTVEMSLEHVLSPVTGMEALSNVKVNAFLWPEGEKWFIIIKRLT